MSTAATARSFTKAIPVTPSMIVESRDSSWTDSRFDVESGVRTRCAIPIDAGGHRRGDITQSEPARGWFTSAVCPIARADYEAKLAGHVPQWRQVTRIVLAISLTVVVVPLAFLAISSLAGAVMEERWWMAGCGALTLACPITLIAWLRRRFWRPALLPVVLLFNAWLLFGLVALAPNATARALAERGTWWTRRRKDDRRPRPRRRRRPLARRARPALELPTTA